MVRRRYCTQVKEPNVRKPSDRVSGNLSDCRYFFQAVVTGRQPIEFDWIRIVEQVWDRQSEMWVDSRVIDYREKI